MENLFRYPEWIGIAASFLVVLSFLMSHIFWIRLVNMVGAIGFIVYGLIIEKVPVALPNMFIVIIQSYYLIKYQKGHLQQ